MTIWKRRASVGLSAALLASLIATAAAGSALAAPAVSYTVTPASATVPADGTSTITFTFAGYETASANVTIMTTAGTFSATSAGSGFVIGPSGTFATVTNPNDIAAGATLTLKAPAKARSGVVTVWLTPVGGGAAVIDSTTAVHFTATGTPGDKGGRDSDRGKGHGARKTAFYSDPAYTCAAGAQPASGAQTFGFAVLRTTGHRTLEVTVALKGALPNATYDLWVNQDPGACPLGAPTKVGAVHTNALGNGNGHVRVALVSGATNFWVSATSGPSVLRTKAVQLKLKGR